MERILSTKILGTKVSTEGESQIIKKIIKSLKTSSGKIHIVTPNPEILVYALRQKEYQGVLNRAQVSLPDGIGVLSASKILQKGIMGRITGVDFMQKLARECAKEGLTTGFFGGMPGVAEMTAECLQKSYPNLKVVYESDVWDERQIKGKSIDVLFVALGFPKQEEWIAQNIDKIPVKCAMGVGGAFDYVSGKVKRAPKFIRKIGLEWLFRLMSEPWRFKRQLALPVFAYYIIIERLFGKNN